MAVLTQESSFTLKLAACAALAISHVPADALPHQHWYSFEKMNENIFQKLGALVELFGGLLILPITLGVIFGLNMFWLGVYVISASLLDVLIGLKIQWAIYLNHQVH